MITVFKKNKKKEQLFVFLDVDGVLNCQKDWVCKFTLKDSCLQAFGVLVQQLKLQYKTVFIVICSTWRAGKSRTGEQDATQYSILKEKLKNVGISVYGETPISNKGRQAEIEYYIRRNDVTDYIVIDDDPSLFDNVSNLHFYKPDYRTGLTSEDIKPIVRKVSEFCEKKNNR